MKGLDDGGFDAVSIEPGSSVLYPTGTPWFFGINTGITTDGAFLNGERVSTVSGNQVAFILGGAQSGGGLTQYVRASRHASYHVEFDGKTLGETSSIVISVGGGVNPSYDKVVSGGDFQHFVSGPFDFSSYGDQLQLNISRRTAESSSGTILIDNVRLVENFDSSDFFPTDAPGASGYTYSEIDKYGNVWYENLTLHDYIDGNDVIGWFNRNEGTSGVFSANLTLPVSLIGPDSYYQLIDNGYQKGPIIWRY